MTAETRHVISLSGGKDSSALAIYLKDKITELEYIFCDTGEELPETYAYLDKLEHLLAKPIKRIKADLSFREMLEEVHHGFLPSPHARWCTRELKIAPFEKEIGESTCYMYIGIRADEAHRRKGYIPAKENIIPRYPFIDDNIQLEDVIAILEQSGLGLPAYYDWRSRSGCYFCFFQRKVEWVGLLKNHPDLYQKAAELEKLIPSPRGKFTWIQGISLQEFADPEHARKVEERYREKQERERLRLETPILDLLDGLLAEKQLEKEPPEDNCVFCSV